MEANIKDNRDYSIKIDESEKKENKSEFKPDHNIKPPRDTKFKPNHNIKPPQEKRFKPDHNIKPPREPKFKPILKINSSREKKFKPDPNIKPPKDKKFKPDPNLTPTKDAKNKIYDAREIEKLKQDIKNLDWDKNSPDWTITDGTTKKTIHLDPTQDCSKINPLHRNKKWLKRVYNDEKLGLTDRKLAIICGVKDDKTIRNWRKKLDIPAKPRKYNDPQPHLGKHGYIISFMPKDYRHPELKPNISGWIRRFEHVIVMENYLKENPELDISKECLIDGKYLKTRCAVHHINHIRTDNRIENLWLYKTRTEHNKSMRSLNNCFRDMYKLGQLQFSNGKYSLNHDFNFKSLDPSEIKKILKPNDFKGEMNIEEIKQEIKSIDWYKTPNDWTVCKFKNQHGEIRMSVNPYQECSKENPLYKSKAWVVKIVKDKRFNLTDTRLAKVCGISERTAYRWRWEKHKIPTYDDRWGKNRIIRRKRVWIKVPKDYKNPFASKLIRQNLMLEYRFVIEKYLAKHPELEISQKSLLNGKFLKPDIIVHHVNLDTLDNRLENLWVCESIEDHNSIHTSLLDLIDPLIKAGLLSFKEAKYYLEYEE